MGDTSGSSGASSLKKVHSVSDAVRLVWNQTRPLFVQPNLANMLILCLLMFFMFAVSQGMQLWYYIKATKFEYSSHF